MDLKILQIHSFRIIISFRFSHSAVSVIPSLISDWENQASIIDVIVFSYLILFASIFKSKIYLLPYVFLLAFYIKYAIPYELSSYYMSCHLGILVWSSLEILGSSLLNSHLPLFLLLAVHLQIENYLCPFVLDASGH